MFNFNLTDLLLTLLVIVPSLTVHEFSHAYSAYLLGDGTARAMGRLSLNPLRHLDPVGFVCLCFFRFGWAKPVPVNPYNFHAVDGKTGMLLTSLAGPMSNILLCFLGVGLFYLLPGSFWRLPWIFSYLQIFIVINASLAFFNLLPVPPLDGSKILAGILPDSLYFIVQALDRFGFIFLVLLIASNIPERIIGPLSGGLITVFSKFFMLFV